MLGIADFLYLYVLALFTIYLKFHESASAWKYLLESPIKLSSYTDNSKELSINVYHVHHLGITF